MNPITQAQLRKGRTNLATGKEITKQAVSKAVSQGKLTTCEVGSKKMVDLDGHLTVEWIRAHPIQAAAPVQKPAEPTPPTTPDPPPQKPQTPASAYLPQCNNPSGLPSDDNQDQDGHGKTWHDIELKKQQIEEKRIKNEQQRGNLIEKPLIELLFGKMYQIDVDQIKTIGIELSPKIITVLNKRNRIFSNEICEIFEEKDKEVKKHIESILNSGEKDIKTKIISICEDLASNILGNVRAEIDNFLKMMATDE